jgi:hypothetical protein
LSPAFSLNKTCYFMAFLIESQIIPG